MGCRCRPSLPGTLCQGCLAGPSRGSLGLDEPSEPGEAGWPAVLLAQAPGEHRSCYQPPCSKAAPCKCRSLDLSTPPLTICKGQVGVGGLPMNVPGSIVTRIGVRAPRGGGGQGGVTQSCLNYVLRECMCAQAAAMAEHQKNLQQEFGWLTMVIYLWAM